MSEQRVLDLCQRQWIYPISMQYLVNFFPKGFTKCKTKEKALIKNKKIFFKEEVCSIKNEFQLLIFTVSVFLACWEECRFVTFILLHPIVLFCKI